ncbi:xanthine dehydrogenase small subunit [soil metagenome]
MSRGVIRLLRRGRILEISALSPMRTLLDHLRLTEHAMGTKEGCNEGDCGACTVALGSVRDGRLVYEPVNACILLAGQADGKELVTVDDLNAADGTLHPVQQALVDHHGSQCGFCTPGIVMSLFTLYQRGGGTPDWRQAVDQLAGNLCRCTGYRPIVAAAQQACSAPPDDAWSRHAAETSRRLTALADGEDIFIGTSDRFLAAPASLSALRALTRAHKDVVFVAGATDVGLWITKQLRDLPRIILLGRISGLDHIAEGPDEVSLGGGVTYARAETALRQIDPDLGELLRRLGSKQVRASGTVGGNIANGSPIGDTPPALIALGAAIEITDGESTRTLPLEDFFIAYGRQDRRPEEIVWRITIPTLGRNESFRCYKISKRFDQDISAVMGAFKLTIDSGRIMEARIAYGGMAATPQRAAAAEHAVIGQTIGDAALAGRAGEALLRDFKPLDDHRASAAYRMETAQALLTRALTEIAGVPSQDTRIVGWREANADAA